MFRKIMVPVDGSATSKLGLEEAIKLAKDQKASLYLFHAVDEFSLIANASAQGGGVLVDRLVKDIEVEGRRILVDAEAVVRKHRIRAISMLVENTGSPTSALILKQAKKWGVDLIVLGTHGRRGIRRLVMGSDAEGVIRTTHVPVLLVRSGTSARRPAKKKARKI